jgi:hypothetical protein
MPARLMPNMCALMRYGLINRAYVQLQKLQVNLPSASVKNCQTLMIPGDTECV